MKMIILKNIGHRVAMMHVRTWLRAIPFALGFSALLLVTVGAAAQASAEERSLKLYFCHTGERAVITFKRNGVFEQNGLNQLNRFLRDWRRDESTKMDPRLFDIVWEIYRRSGATEYINVVSGYRSPDTNSMLRTRSSGVAKESQHTRGKAIDFFIPGVKLATLRGLAMQLQGGGVGYYPTSGSPFVHVDVGGVRAWPRMNRQELVQLFPTGKTLHIPADGKPLPGYEIAVGEYKRRGASLSVELAAVGKQNAAPRRGNLLAALFGGDKVEEEEDVAESETSSPAQRTGNGKQADAPQAIVLVEQNPGFKAPVPTTRPMASPTLTAFVPSSTTASHQALASISSATVAVQEGRVTDAPDQTGSIPIPSANPRSTVAAAVTTLAAPSATKRFDTPKAVNAPVLTHSEVASAFVAPSAGSRPATTTFSSTYTTGYPAEGSSKPVAATASFDFGRFGNP